MKRRELLQWGAAASVVAPISGLAQVSKAADWTPKFFDAHQNETVVALSELIIPATDTPGAKAALVNRWMDVLLEAGPIEQRRQFLSGLQWLDGYAMKLHAKPFVKCSGDQQVAMLTTLDEGTAAGIDPGKRFFRQAKGFISRLYYATEIGMAELNKGGRVPASFGCHDAAHA
jgi:hypothetical protein